MRHKEPRCSRCPYRRSALYSPLSEHEIEALRSPKATRYVQAKGIIQHYGRGLDELYSLGNGWAFRFKLLATGRRQILSFLLPGDFVTIQGLLARTQWFSVQAITSVSLCAFDAAKFRSSVARSEALLDRVEKLRLEDLIAMDERIMDLGRRPAVERVARLILEIRSRLDRSGGVAEDGSFPFPLRHEHLADALGLTPVHVSRTIGELRNLDLIALERQRLTVKDRACLMEIAGVADRDLDFAAASVLGSPRASD